MQEEIAFLEDALCVAGAMFAWRGDRADDRKADLAAMGVAGEHEVEVGRDRPFELIGCVRKQNPERLACSVAGRHIFDVGRWHEPRQFISGQQKGLPIRIDRSPPTAEVLQAGLDQHLSKPRVIDEPIVVAEDKEHSESCSQPAEYFDAPLQAMVAVEQITGDDCDVGLPSICLRDHFFEIGLCDPAADVQIAQLSNSEAVMLRRQPLQFKLLSW